MRFTGNKSSNQNASLWDAFWLLLYFFIFFWFLLLFAHVISFGHIVILKLITCNVKLVSHGKLVIQIGHLQL